MSTRKSTVIIISIILGFSPGIWGETSPGQAASPGVKSSSLDQAKAILSSGGSLANIENRLSGLLEAETDPSARSAIALELARLLVVAGDYPGALKVLRPFSASPSAAHLVAKLALVCNDEETFKAALFPLLSDPLSPDYPQARQILALQLLKTEKYAAVLETLGKETDSDDLSALLAWLSLQRLDKPAEARQRLGKYTSRPAGQVLRNLAETNKGWEFEPVFLVLFGMGDVPGLLELSETEERSVAAAEEEKASAPPAKGGVKQDLIQVGWFASMDNAKVLQKRLESMAFQVRIIKDDKKNPVRYKVVVEVPQGLDPQTILISLKDKDIEGFLTH